ncbi:GNAT family N-acetyltransferase [Paenibacillus aestuarii]|uniref:GNAT family N-acetyltransferase n=1 Tax=Paenibacillus aestuarii TaxID=516965 RepID=A0ABW0K648_9BACL|nr:GNAT family protein [Paenibacillus aestuarii]
MAAKQIKLRAFETHDIHELHRWSNDPDAIRTVGRIPQTLEQIEKLVEKKRSRGDLCLAAEDGAGRLIGWVFLKDIEHDHGRAAIGILLAPEARGQGYGQIVMEQMIDIGFQQLRLNRIYLTTRGFNDRAIRLYEKIGFVIEGKLRQHAFMDGVYTDTYLMGLLASEWKQK